MFVEGEIPSQGYDRMDPGFQEYKMQQTRLAQITFSEMYGGGFIGFSPLIEYSLLNKIDELMFVEGEIPSQGYDRMDPGLQEYKMQQTRLAQITFSEMHDDVSITNEYFGMNDNEEIIQSQTHRIIDSELQKAMENENLKAQETLNEIFGGKNIHN